MLDDQYSLSNLRDIVIPEPPPLWPPAPGAWVALGMALAIATVIAWRVHAGRKRNAYRKAGLLLLSRAATVYDVSVVLKRVALAAFPREQVASLCGDDWAAFLHKTCPRQMFEELVTSDAGTESDEDLVEMARTWIRHHRVPETDTSALVN